MHLAVALENSALRRICEFLHILLAGLPDFWMQSDFSRMRNLFEHEFIAVDFDFVTLPSSPLLLHVFRHRVGAAYQAEILSAASRAEMADDEQMKKIVPFVTCEITFGQHVCELVFGVNVSNLNFRIKVSSVKQLIQSNAVGS